ncbi:M56 family metallopeptidase [uncultured Psychroserpens sp.]|uniref:M56 family metallopeptidase n=1 Tax=uncultured Psychroserpens sp. TaxID=255436 RepID=UPI002622EADD|nr:M56 family metallopeptidase [uncultured Psychroserpens sp.]
MLIYLLKFSVCLAIFMVFYKLFLEQLSIHVFKRIYLIGIIICALIIPSITITEYIEPVISNVEIFESTVSFDSLEMLPVEPTINYTPYILWSIYILGVVVFFLKFCLNLRSIFSRIKNNPKYKSENFINVLVTNLMVPHTFFSYIFLNKYKFEHEEIPNEVILHEQTHAKQKHSIDILFLECLQIVFWFNPLIYFLKRDVKMNHEFLADHAVLSNGVQPSTYQNIILAFSSKASDQHLANAINYSSIKKRFTVMKTKTSKTSIWFKSLLLIPLLALSLYSFTNKEQVVRAISDDSGIISEGVTDAQMKEYNDFIIQFNTTHIIDYSKYERIVSIYNLMSEKQRNSVEPYPKIPNVDLSKTKAKTPTKTQFESWKNSKEFAIWIDGVHVPNARLNSYNVHDIAHYTGSFVHKNARSKKFPQPHQFSLYTKKGFKNTYQESKIKEYRVLTKKYKVAIETFLKGDRKDISELVLLNERCYRLYKSFTDEELKKHKILPPPPPPAPIKLSVGATPEQVAEYNKMAKFLNDKSIENRLIKLKDYKRLERIYKLMSKTQRANAEPFPKLPPPPPRPSKPKNMASSSLPSSFTHKLNDSLSYNFTSVNMTQQNTPKGLPEQSEAIKRELDYRKMIIHVAEKTNKKSIYKIDGKPVSLNKINKYLSNFPRASVKARENSNGSLTLSFSNSDSKKMSPIELQSVYSIVFSKYDSSNENLSRLTSYPVKSKTNNGPNANEYDETLNETVKTGFKKINGIPHYFVSIDGQTKYYNRQGFQVSKEGKILSSSQVNASDVIPNQYVTKVYTNDIVVAEFKDDKPNLKGELNIPPPPPKSPLDNIIDMAKKDATFYLDDKIITSDKAIEIVKHGNYKHIQTINERDEKPILRIEQQPIVNNKVGLPKPTASNIVNHIKVMNRHGARFYLGNKELTYKDALSYIRKHKDAIVDTSMEANVVKISPKDQTLESPLVFVIAMSKRNAKFFFEGEEITSNKAISLVKRKGGLLEIKSKNVDSKQPSIYLSKKGALVGTLATNELVVFVNGKTPVNGQISLSKDEFNNLKLTMEKLEIKSFKFKVPGKRTESISGNTLNKTSKSYIKPLQKGSAVQFFDIKSKNGLKLKPIVVTIID